MGRTGSKRSYRIGVDIGGTFTDVVVVDESDGSVKVTKVPTVPADPSAGFIDGLTKALTDFAVDPGAIAFTVHGTTIATNTIIQGTGARAGLITSGGFSDILEIAYQTRPTLYDIFYDKPKPLVPRYMCIGVRERIGPDGEVLVPLDEEDVAAAARKLIAEGAEAIAVAFLHSYRDPAHERRAAEIIGEAAPGIPVVQSAEVCREFREYPRTSTAVINAVLVPKIAPYLARLEERLVELGLESGLHLMTSSGGIITSATAKRLPVHLVESGPAAGVIGAAFVAETMGEAGLGRKILALDIGGTTAKASLVDDGMPALADEFEVGAAALPTSTSGRGQGYPVKMPVISLVEIGAGGGSVASIDPGGALTVGPESAGANPGPACYGMGGDRPTITDANLVLGRLNPDYFLGGALAIYLEQARAAIERDIARPLGLDVDAAARAVIDIANAKMIAALQLISIQRGIDPRDYVLVPSGGAGPVHVMAIAAALGVETAIIPPTPGLNSALGLLATDIKQEIVRGIFEPITAMDVEAFRLVVEELNMQGRALLAKEHVDEDDMELMGEAEVSYLGQSYPLRIRIPAEAPNPLAAVDAAFRDAHRRHYGYASETEVSVIRNLRITALGRVERPRLKPLDQGDGDIGRAQKGARRVVFDAAIASCPIFERGLLLAGDVVAGPAIIEQMDTTLVVPPGASVRADRAGSLVATVKQGS